MKRYSYLFLLLLLLSAAIQGCQKSDPDGGSPGGDTSTFATLHLGIATSASAAKSITKAGVLGEGVLGKAEYAIKTLRVFVFESTGELDVMESVTYPEAITYSVAHNILVKKADNKRLYVVVNEPKELADMAATLTTEAQLDNLNFTIAEQMNKGLNAEATFAVEDFLIPMSATTTVSVSGDTKLEVWVDRAVARFDLMLDKSASAAAKSVKLTTATTFAVEGILGKSALMAGGALPTPSSSELQVLDPTASSEVEIPLTTSDHSSAVRILSFYMAERNYDATNVDTRITIAMNALSVAGSSVNIKNTLVLGGGVTPALSKIERNHIYRIYATYTGVKEQIVPDDFKVVDWNYEELNGDIEGVMLVVKNTLAVDWLRNGNTFKAPNHSFGSNKPIEIQLPVLTGEVDDRGALLYDFEPYAFEGATAGSSYDLLTLPLANHLIAEMAWIKEAKLTFTSPKTGYLSVTYFPTSTTYDRQSYPIRIKSDNVVKQMTVVYDNSYIPPAFLPDHWADRAPGGVVFAKRGYALHPRDVADVLYRDKDGYYRGDPKMALSDADAYCKQIGPMWYLPSQKDMEAMIPGVKELGTSYRFQDTGSPVGGAPTQALYWSSTESATTPGSYWTGDFSYNRAPIVDVYDWMEERPSTETHYVRCALDIK